MAVSLESFGSEASPFIADDGRCFVVMMNDDEKKDRSNREFSLFSHCKALWQTKKYATTTLLTMCYTTLTKEIGGISDGFDI